MFKSHSDVIDALRRYRDFYDPRTTSVMGVGIGGFDSSAEPFRPGFIVTFDERRTLEQRLRLLAPKARRLLILWHVEGHPVSRVARMLDISRVHCYRLAGKALESMLDPEAVSA